MVEKYRKKPVLIEAVQWLGDIGPVIDLVGHGLPTAPPPLNGALMIQTLEGDMRCDVGDWIIKGVQGEFYPCKNDIFLATYEHVIG